MSKKLNIVFDTDKSYKDLLDYFKNHSVQKADDTPRPNALRETAVCIARFSAKETETCEVYDNGYAIYENETHYTVFWACKDAQKLTLSWNDDVHTTSEEILACPWTVILMDIGVSRINNNMTRANKEKETSLKENSAQVSTSNCHCSYFYRNPESIVMERWVINDVRDKVQTLLNENQRKVIELFYYEGMTQAEIAEHLHISQPAVHKRLESAYTELKKKIGIEYLYD